MRGSAAIRSAMGLYSLAALAACAVPPSLPIGVEAPVHPPAFDPASATALLIAKVTVRGTLPRMRAIRFEGMCRNPNAGPAFEEVVVARDGKLANTIVWVSRGADRWTYSLPSADVSLSMRDAVFHPHVLTLEVGQLLRVSNPDHGTLHFLAVSQRNGEISRKVLKGEACDARFTAEEVGVRLKCDVHGWMLSWAGVFDHPFHGVTGADGTVTMRLPPGEYTLAAWHEYEKFEKPAPQSVVLAEGETRVIEFVYGVK